MIMWIKFIFLTLLIAGCFLRAAQINPVDMMQDVVIEEGTRQTADTPEEKQKAFRKMMLEKVFLKDMFSNEQSIYKPDSEDGEVLNMSKGMSSIYSSYMRKQMAEHLAAQGFLDQEVQNASR